MKISNREKAMLLALGIFVIGILYYQFGYTTLAKMAEEKTTIKNDIQEKYDNAMNTINSMEAQKSKVKMLHAKIDAESEPFYPTISQEHIILEIDKLIEDSGLEGGMTFEAKEVKGVESLKKSEKDKDLEESSLQDDADNYNYKYGESKDDKDIVNEKNNEKEVTKTNKESAKSGTGNTSNSSESSSSKATKDAKSDEANTITQIKVNVDFNGSYENVVKFLKALGEYNKKIPIYTINMSEKSLEEVKGSVNMIVYSIPKIDGEMSEYLKWKLNNTYGKSQPFNVDSSVGTGIKSDTDVSDFMVQVKPVSSELPTIMIGKANDILRTTYAYGDGDNEQNVEMIFTKKDDKYYYKYKTASDKIPIDYNDPGNEFVPNSENIVLSVSSENRLTSNDKAGLKLKIVNDTDKLVKVNKSGDDVEDPRVSIDGDSKNISVNSE